MSEPVIHTGWVCEAAAQGLYTQELLITICEPELGKKASPNSRWEQATTDAAPNEHAMRRKRWDRVWELATEALQRGLDEGLVVCTEGGAFVLTDQGQEVLDEHRKARRPMLTFAFNQAANKLRKQRATLEADERKAAAALEQVNGALDRILGL